MTGRGRVPIGRRFLFTDRRHAVLSVLGVAASLLLVLLLGGIFAGAIDRVTHYIRTSDASVFVSQRGVRTMHMSASALPARTVGQVEAVPGVAWAAPIEFTSGPVAGPAGRQLSYVIGYDAQSGRGGPGRLVDGRAPGPGEVVVDELAADQMGVRLGGLVDVLGVPLTAVGFSDGGTSITNTTVFVTLRQFAALRGTLGGSVRGSATGHSQAPISSVSYVLIGTNPGVAADTVANRIRQAVPGVTVQTRDEFAASEARVVTDMSADLLRLMSSIGLLIALAVIALGLMTATLSKIREFAVLKALGSRTARLAGVVTVQVLWTVLLATATAAVIAVAVGALLPLVAPTVQVTITAAAVARAAVSAGVVGMIAALWPLRRIAQVDAATAFREAR